MRLLFYTATITLLLAGGVFAYFAVQTPQIDTSTKVVIGIEPYAAAVAEAKTNEILKQQAKHQEQDQSTPDSYGDRLPQGEEPAADALTGGDARTETAALNDSGPASPEAVPQEQALAEESVPPSAEPQPENQGFSLPGANVSGFDPLFQNTEPAATVNEPEQHPVAESETPPTEPGIEEKLDNSLASNDLTGTTAEPESNEEAATPQPVEQDVAALDGSQADQLPIEENAATESVPEPVYKDTQNEDVQSSKVAVAAVPDTDPQEEAKTDVPANEEDVKKLRATFNAFVASLKEKEGQEELALVTPPPLPLKRPENIPAPVRTASLTSGTASTPRVAILLRGLGRNDKNSEFAVTTLPSAISLGFAPYVGSAQQWAQQARERGHEVIIQLPFEPSDYPKTNPGPETILTTSNASENTSKLRTVLARFDGYNGVTSYYGGKLLQSPEALRPVLEDIKSRGLIYVSEPDASQALVRKLAAELGVIYGGADIIVDNFQTNDVIQKNLEQLVELARKNGSAIGMAYASRNSIEQLRIWSETVTSKGVTLVPVGVLAQTPGAS